MRRIDEHVVSVIAQDVVEYVKEKIIPNAPPLELSMIALAGGFPEEQELEEVPSAGDV